MCVWWCVHWCRWQQYTNLKMPRSCAEQHSISVFSVNLDVSKPVSGVTEPLIQLTISAVFSTNLQLFHVNTANRTRQICGIMSAVTGVGTDNIILRANTGPATFTDTGTSKTSFQIVLSMLRHKSAYQEQRVRRLGVHLSQPGTRVRVRVDSMLQKMVETWTLQYVPGYELSIVAASVHFVTSVLNSTAQPPSSPHRRRLLGVSDSTKAPLRRAASTAWNQTSTFFLRSHDMTDNSDSMLAFLTTSGDFSRMCVLTVRYSLASYCRLDETQILEEMNALLAEPLRMASGGHIVRCKPVAIAPAETISCPSAPRLDLPPTLRRSGGGGANADLLLHVEIIVYSDASGSFTLLSTPELQNAGVSKINIISTKRTRDSGLAVSLDASGFLSDGSLQPLPYPVATSSSSTAAVIAGVMAGLLAVSCAVFAYLQWQKHRRQCMSAHAEMPVQYTSMPLVPGGCSCMPRVDRTSSSIAALQMDHPLYARVGLHFPGHVYAM